MAEIAVTVQASGEAYVALVVGAAPEIRDSVALDVLEAADAIPALDGLVLDFDHYGRLVGLRITGAVDSILAPSLLEVAVPGTGLSLTEFPADDPERARRFWVGFLAVEMEAREAGEGDGWRTHSGAPALEPWSAVPSQSHYRPRNRHVLRRAAANRTNRQPGTRRGRARCP